MQQKKGQMMIETEKNVYVNRSSTSNNYGAAAATYGTVDSSNVGGCGSASNQKKDFMRRLYQ